MKRLLKWLLPVLVLAEVGLVRLGFLDFRDAILIVIAVEVLLLVVGGSLVWSAIREYRRNRTSGFDGWKALQNSLTMLLPRLAARLIVSELRLFYCLARWILRRTRLRAGDFSYHKHSTMDMIVLMVVLVSPIEVLIIELLLQAFLPLLWLRILVLFLEIYAVLWILGFHASRVALPHRLKEAGLRLHHGIFAEGFVPYPEIRQVQKIKRKAPEWGDGLQVGEDEAYLAIGGNTNVTLELRSTLTMHGFIRPTGPVNIVHLAADDPERLSEKLKERTTVEETTGQPSI